MRDWFDGQGFLEVETPARVRSPGQEVHLQAVAAGEGHWLITSPEYHLKKLVAAGMPRLYELCRCWRADESGPHHATEFTMLEWYRAEVPLAHLADDCEALVRLAFRAAGREPPPDVDAPFTRTTVRELFASFAGIELLGDEDPATLRAKAEAAGVFVGSATAWDDIFFQIFLDRVEPALAAEGPTFVFDWPAPLGALARPHPSDPRLVERFELYAGGLELANAFGELTDPVEQRRRFQEEAAVRAAPGPARLPAGRRAAGGAAPHAAHGRDRAGVRPAGHAGAGHGPDRRRPRISAPLSALHRRMPLFLARF